MSPEKTRLQEHEQKEKHWKKWGSYLSEREWGTVREDYSVDETSWEYFPFDHAKSRVYRWGEDGIGGICDNHQNLCFAFTFWNEKDPILKERLFGLSNGQGNHGEDVKEYYYYLDNTPTHSYMKFLYKYPHAAFPYDRLLEESQKRNRNDEEFELIDTGVFEENRYFDLFIEYAKADAEDLCIQITIENRGDEEKTLHLLPTLWARNTWEWDKKEKPQFSLRDNTIIAEVPEFGTYALYGEGGKPLFTDNETGQKDLFHKVIINQQEGKRKEGTKAAFHYAITVPSNGSKRLAFRLSKDLELKVPLEDVTTIIEKRKEEADEFYEDLMPKNLGSQHRSMQRQAFAGMLWNKQFYYYVVERWLEGEDNPEMPPRMQGRNAKWSHLYNDDVLSVPDKWEYPSFFSWDLAFHTLPLAILDPQFAKRQLTLLTREWYMHPNGQLPAYEWNFDNVNPPVHAWATWRVYKIEQKRHGNADYAFLEGVFQKLAMNFTWWVNRKDKNEKNIFEGGFLGLDNISVFNRSEDLPPGSHLYQSDATSWMGMYCLQMLKISLELAKKNPVYEEMAAKFCEHFLYIAEAINYTADDSPSLWDKEDGFYYDVLTTKEGESFPLKVRSMVGLIPLFAVLTLDTDDLDNAPHFKQRMEWFINHRPDLCSKIACMKTPGEKERRILAFLDKDKLKCLMKVMLDEEKFLSPYGIRSLSKCHEKKPYHLKINEHEYCVDYEPAESKLPLFGGNSNWRGPIWFPLNMLIIESLQKYHHYHGDNLKVEGSVS